jgi:branched-chain amino acid transport system substrate-binding protein
MSFRFLICSLWSFLFVACSAAHCQPTESKSLKVAAVLGMSGDAAIHASHIRHGIELAADDLKARGWQLDIRYEDDQTDAAKTVSAMQLLVAKGYTFFIGPTWSFQVNAVRGLVAAHDLVAMVPAGSSEINGGAIPGVFNLAVPRVYQLPQVTDWLNRQGYRRAIILTPNDPWGEVHRDVFKRAVKEASGSVVTEEQYDYGIDTASLRAIFLKAKAANPDVLIATGAAADMANMIKARNALGLKFAVIGTDDVKDALSAKLLTARDVAHEVFALEVTVGAAFKELYRKRFNQEPPIYSDCGYDALMLLAEATQRTTGTPAAVRELFNSGGELTGVSGPIIFDGQGDLRGGVFQISKVGASD